MLTRSDIQQVRGVVNESLAKKVEPKLEKYGTNIKAIKNDIAVIKKDIKGLKKDNRSIKSLLNEIISYFERDFVGLRKRVERIEEHVRLPST